MLQIQFAVSWRGRQTNWRIRLKYGHEPCFKTPNIVLLRWRLDFCHNKLLHVRSVNLRNMKIDFVWTRIMYPVSCQLQSQREYATLYGCFTVFCEECVPKLYVNRPNGLRTVEKMIWNDLNLHTYIKIMYNVFNTAWKLGVLSLLPDFFLIVSVQIWRIWIKYVNYLVSMIWEMRLISTSNFITQPAIKNSRTKRWWSEFYWFFFFLLKSKCRFFARSIVWNSQFWFIFWEYIKGAAIWNTHWDTGCALKILGNLKNIFNKNEIIIISERRKPN